MRSSQSRCTRAHEAYTDRTRRCTRPDSQLRRHDAVSFRVPRARPRRRWSGCRPATRVTEFTEFDEGSTDRGTRCLYMHDGQNLFEPETAFQKGEHWRVGETAAELIEAGRIEPLIIVGIYNTGESPHRRIHADRRREAGRRPGRRLRPDDHRGAEAAHRSHLSHAARVASTPASAARRSAGSSRCTLASRTRQVFGRARRVVAIGVVGSHGDPEDHARRRDRSRSCGSGSTWAPPKARRGLDDARLLKAALVGLGFVEGVDLHYAEYEGATHSEQAWSERVGPDARVAVPWGAGVRSVPDGASACCRTSPPGAAAPFAPYLCFAKTVDVPSLLNAITSYGSFVPCSIPGEPWGMPAAASPQSPAFLSASV